jgi:catechol 2,3-dioxygenase-like lactoylglutathione lyase family enzyme
MRVHHVAIQVNDLERAVRWYRDLFELPVLKEWPDDDGRVRAVWLKLSDDAFVALERCSGKGQPSGWWHPDPGIHVLSLRIAADERARWEQRLSERGVPVDHRSKWTLFLRDPEGNRIGLSHHPEELE